MDARCRHFVMSIGLLLAAAGLLGSLPGVAAADPTPAPTATPSLTLTAAPAPVTAGAPVTFSVNLGVPFAALQLSSEAAGEAAFAPLPGLTSDATGVASFTARPQLTTTYRVAFAGDASWAATSAETTVPVRPRITLSATAAVYEGQRVVFRLQVSPAHHGATVALELEQADGWAPLRQLTLSATSKASLSWPSDRRGRFRFRVKMPADAGHDAGWSAVRLVQVKDPNPYHVPTRPAHYIVVDVSQYLLYYHEHGRIVQVFRCVTGRPALPTPLGHFRIKAKDPHMSGAYGPRRMRYLGAYAIHGTSEPWLLTRFPRNYSHGCTRLSNTHIVWLYARCPVGTPVWNVR